MVCGERLGPKNGLLNAPGTNVVLEAELSECVNVAAAGVAD